MEMNDLTIPCPGTRIKELRKIANLSQEELGRRVGVQRAAINKYEKGVVENIPIKTIERMAFIFGVSPTYIVGWNDKDYNRLSHETKILEWVSDLYGKEIVNIIESYMQCSKEGQCKITEYVNDMWKIHQVEE